MLRLFSKKRAVEAEASEVYSRIVTRARHRELFGVVGVADTLNGRFEMLVLHAALIVRRLSALGEAELAQAVVDLMFADLDQALRELGVSDISVAKKIRPMAEAYAGRSAAYERALKRDAPARDLEDALSRNVFAETTGQAASSVATLADYVRRLQACLEGASRSDLVGGTLAWPEPVVRKGDRGV